MTATQQADPYGRGGYCIVVALHGTDSPEAEQLREFRDQYLTALLGGDRLMDLYYRISPPVNGFLGRHDGISSLVAAGISATARMVPPR